MVEGAINNEGTINFNGYKMKLWSTDFISR